MIGHLEKSIESLFEIVKYGLGNFNECYVPDYINWGEILNISSMHGIAAIVFDIQRCLNENIPIHIDTQTKIEWIRITT